MHKTASLIQLLHNYAEYQSQRVRFLNMVRRRISNKCRQENK
jgi:hypothetical protein